MNTNSIYDIPAIKQLIEAERLATDPAIKKQLRLDLLNAIKVAQVERGQRTRMTYRKG